jgi:hypothetical protein
VGSLIISKYFLIVCIILIGSLYAETASRQHEPSNEERPNDLTIGFLSFLTLANQNSDKAITYFNLQYSRKLSPSFHFYIEWYSMVGQIAYEDINALRIVDKFGVVVLQSGTYWYPLSEYPYLRNFWIKAGVGIASVNLESKEFVDQKLSACLLIGPGYRIAIADFFVLNLGISFNPFPVHITNSTENREQGATQGYGLEYLYPDLSFGFRF